MKNQKKKVPKRKNVSQRVPNGRTMQTRDEFLESGKNYKKPGYESKGFYREVIVIDSNRENELVVVKGSTKGKPIDGLNKTKFKPFVETKDNEGKPIKIGIKFIENKPQRDLNQHQVNQIKKELFKNASKGLIRQNKYKVKKIKKR